MLRVALKDADRRMFTPTPWGCPSWSRARARRSALERINSRLDGAHRFERHFACGKAQMRTRVGLAVCVMMALSPGAAKTGRSDRMRSLARPAFAGTGWRRLPPLRGPLSARVGEVEGAALSIPRPRATREWR